MNSSTESGVSLETKGSPHPRRRASDRVDVEQVLAGGDEIGRLMRSLDWSKTPLGSVGSWPQSLRTTVSTCLNSRSPILVWWGPEMVKIYNDAYRPMLGSKHPKSLGARGRDVWPEIWPIIGPMLNGVLARGQATWSENQLLFLERNGYLEECYFTFSYSPIRDESGGIGGVYSAVTETTGQVLSERRLNVLHALAAGAARARSSTDACEQALSAMALDPRDLPFALLYLVDASGDRAKLTGGIGAIPDHRPTPAELDLRNSEASWLRATTSELLLPISLPGQSFPGAYLVAGLSPNLALDESYRRFLDLVASHVGTGIARAKSLEEAEQKAESLAELDRAKTIFFNNISHEFRTPLTLMLAPTDDLLSGLRGELTPALRTELELVQRNLHRLRRLVNALLDFSRLEANRLASSFEVTDVATLTCDTASAFRSAIERAGLEFIVDCRQGEGEVLVDREMWEQIVSNLVSNAFKFTFEGAIEVTLRETSEAVELEVRDTGVGISAADLPRLFERFQRVEGARARTNEGSGIGLAMVQEFVKLHGGTLSASSTLGAGSSFTVAIPTGRAHLPAGSANAPRKAADSRLARTPFVEEALGWLPEVRSRAEAGPANAPPPAVEPERARAHVLVVDDNADMRHYIRRLLEPRFSVETVSDGNQALAAVRARRPDLVLTDIMMPGIDGFQLLRELRSDERTSAIPVVMLSARAGDEAKVDGLAAGAEDYLVKPFSGRELMARVETHLELARLRSESRERATEMERAVRFSETFVGILGHDLRNPLSAITTAANLLEMRAESERIKKPLGRILSSADRMERMISQLLDFTRIRLGRGLPLRCGRVDLRQVSRAIIDEVAPVHGTSIRLESAGDALGTWDNDRLTQLLSNLTVNACQHGTPGSSVLIRIDGSEPALVRLEVRNEGTVPAELLPVLLEPLRQVGGHFEKRDGSSGLGLGLYITQQIVLAHRGKLTVESSPELGTRFVVELPRHVAGEADGVFSEETAR